MLKGEIVMSNIFEFLIRRCSKGDADAMMQLSLYFREKIIKSDIYDKVADMWVVRAMLWKRRSQGMG
jgi:hypothetical protein